MIADGAGSVLASQVAGAAQACACWAGGRRYTWRRRTATRRRRWRWSRRARTCTARPTTGRGSRGCILLVSLGCRQCGGGRSVDSEWGLQEWLFWLCRRTALHRASLNGHTETAMALVEAGVDVHSKDNDGYGSSRLHPRVVGLRQCGGRTVRRLGCWCGEVGQCRRRCPQEYAAALGCQPWQSRRNGRAHQRRRIGEHPEQRRVGLLAAVRPVRR